ncbi:hypothetical protein DL764_010190 [Monosporascus ibericus]|uniref:Uncharacterized protein n=1 Tax=Monosporascus ibericus TaxID=155417 RepID=A0A4Q4ST59_9PEZI|nr:hypothetical protein DL764_010190 [Monosporascus ibericus]
MPSDPDVVYLGTKAIRNESKTCMRQGPLRAQRSQSGHRRKNAASRLRSLNGPTLKSDTTRPPRKNKSNHSRSRRTLENARRLAIPAEIVNTLVRIGYEKTPVDTRHKQDIFGYFSSSGRFCCQTGTGTGRRAKRIAFKDVTCRPQFQYSTHGEVRDEVLKVLASRLGAFLADGEA